MKRGVLCEFASEDAKYNQETGEKVVPSDKPVTDFPFFSALELGQARALTNDNRNSRMGGGK